MLLPASAEIELDDSRPASPTFAAPAGSQHETLPTRPSGGQQPWLAGAWLAPARSARQTPGQGSVYDRLNLERCAHGGKHARRAFPDLEIEIRSEDPSANAVIIECLIRGTCWPLAGSARDGPPPRAPAVRRLHIRGGRQARGRENLLRPGDRAQAIRRVPGAQHPARSVADVPEPPADHTFVVA